MLASIRHVMKIPKPPFRSVGNMPKRVGKDSATTSSSMTRSSHERRNLHHGICQLCTVTSTPDLTPVCWGNASLRDLLLKGCFNLVLQVRSSSSRTDICKSPAQEPVEACLFVTPWLTKTSLLSSRLRILNISRPRIFQMMRRQWGQTTLKAVGRLRRSVWLFASSIGA